MMAAEIDESTPFEAPAISEPQAVPKISDNLHNGGSNPPSVNGTAASGSPDELSNKHIADIVDELVNSAEPSISGGSDTETSRFDPAKHKDGDKGHVRTSSTARKPATFKSVSVNKTFLAAKAAGTPSLAKPGDKPSPTLGVASLSSAPSASASARPRLVAKTGIVKGAGANGRAAAAPDPNAVWNKNRPAPVPEPRKLTDEELKKYGIHISTRLQQEDEAKAQNNWADIEDDDEDWAPEEITWTDGTKSTIPHHDEAYQASPQPHSLQPDLSHSQSLAAAVRPSPTMPVSLLSKEGDGGDKPKSPAPTGVRVGGLPSGRGLILKGAPEKPTLVAKPPVPPTPVKSPWASLPPVDKASPVTMDLPPAIGSTRMPYHHHQQYHQYPPRDMYGGPPRGSSPPPPPFKEIAADDFSRGGFRDGHPHMNRELFNSQSGRLEPVLDRRGGSRSDMHYRQPPSAVLQRHSNAGDQQPEPSPAFQTHRSAGQEGPYGRRRNSSNVSGGSSGFMQRISRPHDQGIPPELHNAQQPSLGGRSDSPASPRNYSPSDARPWQPHGSPVATFASLYSNAAPGAGPHASHAGGPPGPPGAQGPPQIPPQVAAPSIEDELEIQKKIMRERRELAKKRRLEEEEREEAAKRERIRLKLEAMGPAPERKSAKKEASKDESAATAGAPMTPLQSNAQLSSPEEPGVGSVDTAPQPTDSRIDSSADPAAAHRQQQPQPHPQQQTWESPAQTQSERIATWGSANQAARNVWGSPNNRSLGNGTFNSDLGPIGPPSAQKATTASSIAPIGPPKSTVSLPPPPPPTTVQGTAVHAAVVAPAGSGSSTGATRSAWASAVKASDEALLVQQKAHRVEQQREAEARGLTLNDLRPTIKDTWMPTRMNEEGNRVEDKANQSVVHRPGNTVGGSSSPSSTMHAQQPRPSRFFPTRDVRLEEAAASAAPSAVLGGAIGSRSNERPGSPSPPPPDMDGHPAFDGDASHPHVSLPKPQIVVRLPPKDGAGAPAGPPSATRARQPYTQTCSATPPSSHSQSTPSDDNSWQAKFKNLFDRKTVVSPSKPLAGAIRADFHARGSTEHTAPAPTRAFAARNDKPAPKEPPTTRLMAEDCFERQEMGSLPPVHLPNKVPELAWTPAAVPKPLARRFLISSATSGDHEGFLKDYFGAPFAVSIHFPGMNGAVKSVNLPSPRTNSNPRRSGYGRSGSGRHASSSHRGGNKGRDASSTHSGSHGGEKVTPPSTRQGSSGGRSRGGMRHRSENWTRGTSAPVQT